MTEADIGTLIGYGLGAWSAGYGLGLLFLWFRKFTEQI